MNRYAAPRFRPGDVIECVYARKGERAVRVGNSYRVAEVSGSVVRLVGSDRWFFERWFSANAPHTWGELMGQLDRLHSR